MTDTAMVVSEPQNNTAVAPVDNSPFAMFQAVASSGAGLDQIEKMMELQDRWEKREAQKAYVAAMAAFKANPPKINKDRQVAYNNTRYSHASLGNVTEKINAALGEHGLSAAWKTEQKDKAIIVTCTITHNLGHSENTSLSAFADTSGAKNGIQAIGSTITYLQRYTLLALTGLATHDQDDDGKSADPVPVITEKQLSAITDMTNAKIFDEVKFYKYFRINDLSELPTNRFQEAMAMLKKKENR